VAPPYSKEVVPRGRNRTVGLYPGIYQRKEHGMAEKRSQNVEDLLAITKTFFFDLPYTGVRLGLGVESMEVATKVVWKGYDAGVRLVTTAIDSLYRNPLYSEMLNRSLPGVLRWQKFSNALTETFFVGLWRTVSLPTSYEIQALHEDLRSLSAHLLSQSQESETLAGLVADVMMTLDLEKRLAALETQLNGHVTEGNGNGLSPTILRERREN